MVQRILDLWERNEGVSFDVLISQAPFYAHSINRDGLLVLVSNAWAERLGYEPREMLNRPSVDFLTPDSRRKAAVVLPQFYETGHLRNLRYEFVDKNGEIVPVIMNATAIVRDGKFQKSFAVMFDNGIVNAIEQIQAVLATGMEELAALQSQLDDESRAKLEKTLQNLMRAIRE